ncbi:Tyrosine kinase [Entamoeba marina]
MNNFITTTTHWFLYFILFYCVSAVDCWYSNNNIIDVKVSDGSQVCNSGYGWTMAPGAINSLLFTSDCCENNNMYYTFRTTNNHYDKTIKWDTTSTMKTLYVEPMYSDIQFTYDFLNIPNNFYLVIRQSRDDINSNYQTVMKLHTNDVNIKINGYERIDLRHTVTNARRPFVLIDGLDGDQYVNIIEDEFDDEVKCSYGFNGINIEDVNTTNPLHKLISACVINNQTRYILCSTDVDVGNGCGCHIDSFNAETVYTSTGFGFPDCAKNHSFYDFLVSKEQTTVIVDVGPYMWNSIDIMERTLPFSLKSNTTIEFLSAVTLPITSTSFYTPILIRDKLILQQLGLNQLYYFQSLRCDGIDFSLVDGDVVLFVTKEQLDKAYDSVQLLCDFGNGYRYGKQQSTIGCECYWNGEFIQNDCDFLSQQDGNELKLTIEEGCTYDNDVTRYWESLTTTSSSIKGSLVVNTCYLTGNIHLTGTLICGEVQTNNLNLIVEQDTSLFDCVYLKITGSASIFGLVTFQQIRVNGFLMINNTNTTSNSDCLIRKVILEDNSLFSMECSSDVTFNTLQIGNNSSLTTPNTLILNTFWNLNRKAFNISANSIYFQKGYPFLSSVCCENGIQIGEHVTTFIIQEVDCFTKVATFLTIDNSDLQLKIPYLPSYALRTDFVYLSTSNRQIVFTRKTPNYVCDKQLVTTGSFNETTNFCMSYGVNVKTCRYNSDGWYENENGIIDYSCPCGESETVTRVLELSKVNSYHMLDSEFYDKISISSQIQFVSYGKELNVYFTKDLSYVEFQGAYNSILCNMADTAKEISIENTNNNMFFAGESLGLLFFYRTMLLSETGLCKVTVLNADGNICLVCRVTGPDGSCLDLPQIENCREYAQNGECIYCKDSHYLNGSACISCPLHCKQCDENTCYVCENGYFMDDGICNATNLNCKNIVNNRCIDCIDGMYLSENGCEMCENGCIQCHNNTECLICDINQGYVLKNGECILPLNALSTNNAGITSCTEGYYLSDDYCIPCDDNCLYCEENKENEDSICYECAENYLLTTNLQCILNDGSGDLNNSVCINSNQYFDGTKCVSCGNNCHSCSNDGYCNMCEDGYYRIEDKYNNVECKENVIDECNKTSKDMCISCNNGFYYQDNECKKCNEACSECLDSSNQCLKCSLNYVFKDGICVTIRDLNEYCTGDYYVVGTSGICSSCSSYYYLDSGMCRPCIDKCKVCTDGTTCTQCVENYFVNEQMLCESIDNINNCDQIYSSGCKTCHPKYYLNGSRCYSCDSFTPFCDTCDQLNAMCIKCKSGNILTNNHECITVEHCVEQTQQRCTKCSNLFKLSQDGLKCEKRPLSYYLVGPIAIALLIFVILIVLFYFFLLKRYQKKKGHGEYLPLLSKFKIEETKIVWVCLSEKSKLYVDKKTITFDSCQDNIPVDKITKDYFQIANGSGNTTKVSLFHLENETNKISITIFPEVVVLKKDQSCQIEVSIIPHCSCIINENIQIVSDIIKINKRCVDSLPINVETNISTKIDYDELNEEKEIGSGTFGLVYKGNYRGSVVAIKKLKRIQIIEGVVDDFLKEIAMLDKFRCDYIINFHGAVCIPEKLALVTEYAEHGSLRDVINNYPKSFIKDEMKLKFMLDAAKGIDYLHTNGILHRDIKPDNVLIVSMDANIIANAKLTDFGSSRNINLLMTNVTFTKMIGTPVYMAPEVLSGNKYKTDADVFSFGVTLFETFNWGDVYPKTMKSWDICAFVNEGKRVPKPYEMNENVYDVVKKCWEQDKEIRISL